MEPLTKTDWQQITMRIPQLWKKRLSELSAVSGTPGACLLREAIQIGLPILAKQTEDRQNWVRVKIQPDRIQDGPDPIVEASVRGKKDSSRKSARTAAGSPGRRRRTG
jgi:predicted DNA-binding protein